MIKTLTHNLLAQISMSHVKSTAVVALIGNDQLACALTVTSSDVFGKPDTPIRLLATAARNRWIFPLPDDWHGLFPSAATNKNNRDDAIELLRKGKLVPVLVPVRFAKRCVRPRDSAASNPGTRY